MDVDDINVKECVMNDLEFEIIVVEEFGFDDSHDFVSWLITALLYCI